MNSLVLSGALSEEVESKVVEGDTDFHQLESDGGNEDVVIDWNFEVAVYDKRATEKLLMSSQNKSKAFLSNLLNHLGFLVDFNFNVNSQDTQCCVSMTIGITRCKGLCFEISLRCEL